jgi:GTP pyrophosphokinase
MRWTDLKSHLRHLKEVDLKRIEEAFELGKTVHEGQMRKSGEPYFSHPVAVAEMLAEMDADADTIIAALLHDSIEDTNLTLQKIEAQFGESAAALIDGLTKLEMKDLHQTITLDQQIESLRKIFTLMQQDVRIMVIKLVDRLHNMQTVEFLSPERQKAMAKETMEVYVKIADRLCMQEIGGQLEALCLAVQDPDLLKKLLARRERNLPLGKKISHAMEKKMSEDAGAKVPLDVQFEPSSWERLQTQIRSGEGAITGAPPFSVAVVTDSIENCYKIMGVLHQLWQREILSFQDFINSPAINGYRGLHTTVIMEDGTRVRCKIRTEEMHFYARKGIVAHCFDGKATGLMEYLPWLQRISPLSADTRDRSENFWQSLQSDVLGESIVVHGPGDETVMLPNGATALDAAFYLFSETALRTKTIVLNGKTVPFHTPLEYADSLEAHFSTKHTVNHEWFSWVSTGMARANIRRALVAQPIAQKIEQGKRLLQEEFDRYGAGSVDKYLPQAARLLTELNIATVNDLLARVAEGVVNPSDILERIKSKRKKTNRRVFPFLPTRTRTKKYSCLRIRIQGDHKEGPNIQDTIERLSKKSGVTPNSLAIRQHNDRYTAAVQVCSDEKNNIDRFFAQMEAQPGVLRISAMPSALLIMQIGLILLFMVATWLLSYFSIQSIVAQNIHTLLTYSIAFPIVLCNIIAYRYISDYVAIARRSRVFIGTVLFVNAVTIALFTVNMLRGGLDILHLSLFFPLTVLVLSGVAIVWMSAKRNTFLPLQGSSQQVPKITNWKKHQQEKRLGYLIRLGAVIIWGIEPLYIRYTIVNDIAPSLRVFLKAGGGLLPSVLLGVLFAWGIQRKPLSFKLPYTSLFFVIVLGEMVFTYLMNSSLIYTSSTNVILLNNFAPVIALIIAALFWREQIPYLRQTRNLVAIFLLFIVGSLGSTLLFYNDIRFATAEHIWGDTLGMFMMITDVCLVIAMIRYVQKLPVGKSIELNFNIFLFSLMISAPIALLGATNIWQLSGAQILFGIGAGVLSGFGRIMNFAAFRRIDGFLAFLMFNISILITFTLEVFYIQGASSTPLLMTGGLMIIAASCLAEYINSKSEREKI